MALTNATKAGGVKIEISGDARKFDNEIKKSQKKLVEFSKQAKIAMGIAAASFVGAARLVIKNSIDQERAISSLESAMRATGNQAGYTSKQYQDMAADLQRVTTISDTAILSAQSLMLTFKNIGNSVFPRAQKAALDMSVAIGADLTMATRVLGRALDAPEQGLSALRRFGVIFSDSQKDVIKQLITTGRAAEAQGVILKELESRFKGAAEAARNTLGGAMDALRVAFAGSMQTSDLEVLTSAVNELVDLLNDPETKKALGDFAAGLVKITELAVKGGVAFADMGKGLGILLGSAIYGADDLHGKLAEVENDIKRNQALLAEWSQTGRARRQPALVEQVEEEIEALEERKKAILASLDLRPAKTDAGAAPQTAVAALIGDPADSAALIDEHKNMLAEFMREVGAMYVETLGGVPGVGSPEELEEGRELLQEHYDKLAEMEQEYSDQVDAQRKADANTHIELAIQKARAMEAAEAGMWGNINALTGKNLKGLFDQIKQSAIDVGLLKGSEARLSAYAFGNKIGGPPVGAVMAALSVATTAKMIADLKGSGRSRGGSSTGATGAGAATQQQPSRVVQVNFKGGDYERSIGGRMVEMLNDEIRRGGKIEGVQMT